MTEDKKGELLALAERCEAATMPDRLLDWDITRAAMQRTVGNKKWTASLDAAMTLVPEGFNLSIDRIGGESGAVVNDRPFTRTASISNRCASPALALCAAALRARAATPPVESRP